ncbi:hypothetical protein H9643_18810 [Ochrobactrum sp. Sa2BUA5]|nr:hypothetical protein [Ochrobactrum gallinarum]
MDYDLDEFLEEYDDYTHQVSSSGMNLFSSRLKQWFHLLDNADPDIAGHMKWLEARIGRFVIPDEVFIEDGGNANSGKINIPSDKIDRLTSYLYLFRGFVSDPRSVLTFGFRNFHDRSTNVMLDKIISGLFEPFSTELRRYIQKNFDEPVPEDEQLNHAAGAIPASDRIVHINHNQPEFIEISDLLKSVEEDIRGINDADAEIQDRALSELRAANEIIHAQSARYDVLKALLFGCLKWLAIKFADNAVSIAITTLLGLVTAFFGFPI